MIPLFAALLPPFGWSLLCGIFLTLGDVVLRSWFETQQGSGFCIALSIYTLGLLCMMMSCFGQNIAVAGIVAVLINSLGYLLISYLVWGDTVNAREAIGIAMGLMTILVLELKLS